MCRKTLILLALWALTSCTAITGDSFVFVASTPQGARILVDGEDTGLTTPAMVELGGIFASDHEITLDLEGREPETRMVRHHLSGRTSVWREGADESLLSLTFPLWWTLGDWFLPFEVEHRFRPHEVHAKLYRDGEGPVRDGTDRTDP